MKHDVMDAIEGVFKIIFCLFFTMTCYGAMPVAIPDGYATQNGGTTGGGSATSITVSTASAFISAVGNNDPAVIIVQGRLNVGNVDIGSNKTILGADTNAGLYGGTIKVKGSNYIFQNLTFGPSGNGGDVMEISGAKNVFIQKCEFYDSDDELCSIVRQADYVTISWSRFYFDNPDSHSFAHLIGNGDTVTADRGKLHVTLHHNWYAQGVRGRMPRVRFGHVHLYNNYFNSTGNGYCIGIGVECNIRIENSHFHNINRPWADYGGASNGRIGWANLKFEGCSQPTFMPNTFPVFTPPYAFTLHHVDDVRALVTDPVYGAGNRLTAFSDDMPPVVTAADVLTAMEFLPAILTANVDDRGEDDIVSVSWDNPVSASAKGKRMINRAEQARNLTEITDNPGLLQDWIGSDNREAGVNPLTLTLKGLPAGTYSWTSYHHDAWNQSGTFDAAVNDASGTATTTDIVITAGSNHPVSTFTTDIVSNGRDDVILSFRLQPFDGNVNRAFFVMNGFELTGGAGPLFIDFGPAGAPLMLGYQAYEATTENAASFTEKSYSAFGAMVSIQPTWTGGITVTDITNDPSSAIQQATLTADWPGTYSIRFTATDAVFQSDSVTLTVRVGEDACAAVQLGPFWTRFSAGDFNQDCVVNLDDFVLLASQWLDDRKMKAQE